LPDRHPNCRTRFKGCDRGIALISKNTVNADGQLWEIACAYEGKMAVMLMYVKDERPTPLPDFAALHEEQVVFTPKP